MNDPKAPTVQATNTGLILNQKDPERWYQRLERERNNMETEEREKVLMQQLKPSAAQILGVKLLIYI